MEKKIRGRSRSLFPLWWERALGLGMPRSGWEFLGFLRGFFGIKQREKGWWRFFLRGNCPFCVCREGFGIVLGEKSWGGASHSGRSGPKDQRHFYPRDSWWDPELGNSCLFSGKWGRFCLKNWDFRLKNWDFGALKQWDLCLRIGILALKNVIFFFSP